MGREREVKSPDGEHWKVRRRWLDRPGPDLRRRFRRNRKESAKEGALDALWLPHAGDSLGGLTAVAVGIVIAFLFIVVLLPLLGVALELMVLFFVFSSGLLSRLVLGRPWIVEARNLDDGERSVAYGVKGFRRAGEAVDRLATELKLNGPPERLAAGERTTLPRPGV